MLGKMFHENYPQEPISQGFWQMSPPPHQHLKIMLMISSMEIGGAQKQAVNLALYLIRKGHEVRLHAPLKEGPLIRDLGEERCRRLGLPWQPGTAPSHPLITGKRKSHEEL